MRVVLMSKVSIKKAAAELDELSEEERRALRISRFHAEQLQPRASTSSNQPQPRLAHPGGALATNKAAALAKFLKRKLNEPGGVAALDPELVERAVENAKATVIPGQQPAACKGLKIRHVDTFSDSDEEEVLRRQLNAEQQHKRNSKTKKSKTLKLEQKPEHRNKKKSKKKKTKKS
ncbi:uncharacterized protein [Physcomitrium patens]|uniref:Uncharacterized protein n=1 Tax=Physcomitrium patens TaxID=3218 RepID=A0A2K1JCL9_PHYPA|nr:uncharacterized protein LOC112292344 isoform X1 [Physcomitrium patens]PNR39274.1 hypothetical protein PHYPA_019552 [Physcomitrium patens]|eukprot:XP_024396467.1 uncharacterized protein LOC112292344 isoform X1 [Physcomitrella patens]